MRHAAQHPEEGLGRLPIIWDGNPSPDSAGQIRQPHSAGHDAPELTPICLSPAQLEVSSAAGPSPAAQGYWSGFSFSQLSFLNNGGANPGSRAGQRFNSSLTL